jgi:hypothetical protein
MWNTHCTVKCFLWKTIHVFLRSHFLWCEVFVLPLVRKVSFWALRGPVLGLEPCEQPWLMSRWEDIEKGDVSVLTVQVDSWDVIDPHGLIGVITDVKITGGVLVICKSGLLCAMNAKTEYWIPVDRYKLIARAHEDVCCHKICRWWENVHWKGKSR